MNKMNREAERKRLVELKRQFVENFDCGECQPKNEKCRKCLSEKEVDYLLDSGIIAPPVEVRQKVYVIHNRRIWFAVGCLALVALMCIMVIVTTIGTIIMCPGYADPFGDFLICITSGFFALIIFIAIWNLMRIKKGFKSRFK